MDENGANDIIKIKKLTKTYGRSRALDRIDLRVGRGEFLTIAGPNGAGKSTLLGIIAGLIRPTRGEVLLDDVDAVKDRDDGLARKIGVLSFHSFLYSDLTVLENLRFYAKLYDIEDAEGRSDELLQRLGMSKRSHSLTKTLSRGMKQRVALARTLLHDPPVLLLDEPYVGLDQGAMELLQLFLSEKQRTILLVTHDLNRGLEVADRIVIVDRGRIVYDEPKNGLTLQAFDDIYRGSTTTF
jgi:heme exporter protein A